MLAVTRMQTLLQQQYARGAPATAAQQGGSTGAASASKTITTPTVPEAASTKTTNDDQQVKGAKDGERRRRESKSRSRGRDRKSKSPRRKGGKREMTTSSTSRTIEELNKGNINAKTANRSPSRKRQASQEGEDAPPHVARQLPEVDLENVHHAPRTTA